MLKMYILLAIANNQIEINHKQTKLTAAKCSIFCQLKNHASPLKSKRDLDLHVPVDF